MKKAIIIHGWESSPKHPLLAWLAEQLEFENYEVITPTMPSPEKPTIKEWTEKLSELIKENSGSEMILIGHSIGCQAILRTLQEQEGLTNFKVNKILFIAPWLHLQNLDEESESIAKEWLETPINFDKIKETYQAMTCYFSDNDPWVPIADKEIFRQLLNAKIIVEHEKGHYSEKEADKHEGMKKELLA